ncbi:MAG: hypothetical protein K8S25_05770 [Alphaproteobacteria bacterium]|nr:hypothetical protein [Alphaproteobacteria bacterium]
MSTLDPERWFDNIWWRVREQLRATMDERHFDFWIAPLQAISADPGRVVIACRSHFQRDQTVDRYGQRIADLIIVHVPKLACVDFIVDSAPKMPPSPTKPRGIRIARVPSLSLTVARPAMPSSAIAEPLPPAGDDESVATGEPRVFIEDVKRKVAERYAVSVADLESASRKREHVRPRQLAMHLSRTLTKRSFPEIARRFGSRDHSTVIHGCKKIEGLRLSNPAMAAEIEELLRMFAN